MANTSANTRPPVSANALKVQAFYRWSWGFRDGEWVPALYALSSAVIVSVKLMGKTHVLVKLSQKPLILSLSYFRDINNAINRIFTALWEFFHSVTEESSNFFS